MEKIVTNRESIPIKKKIYGKNTYINVIDTSFKQLVPPPAITTPAITLEEFFKAYRDLFYEIPKFGTTNSHEYLIKTSTDYIGYEQNSEDIAALLEEINSLRKELLDANQTIIDLTSKNI